MRACIVVWFAATMGLTACTNVETNAAPSTGNKTFGDRPFWDGDVCVEIRPDGKRAIVPGTRCPART